VAASFQIPQILGNNPLRAIDSSLGKAPFNGGKFNLGFLCFFGSAADGEVVEFEACLEERARFRLWLGKNTGNGETLTLG
jgi:hypothetical protein